jgi:diguanylate cyclase (GGDEF)-like protein/PAS domain S-box-containing protein
MNDKHLIESYEIFSMDIPLIETDTDFKTVVEDAPVMLWLTNIDGKVVFTNSRWKKFVGSSMGSQVTGNTWLSALYPEDKDHCLRVFHEAFLSHQPFEMEYRLRRFDGQYRYIFDTGEPYIKEGKFSGFIGSSTDITERKNYENQLRLSQLELSQHNHEMGLINELNSYLQVCRSLKETHTIVHHYVKQIFTNQTGALYLFDESHTMVEAVAVWGDVSFFSSLVISPDDCWALRQGRRHVVEDTTHAIRCHHIKENMKQGYVCAPAIAQGEMIGFLCVTLEDNCHDKHLTWTSVESRARLISLAADNLAMALVSLKLREALRNRSVRDPMTLLYNRRYLDETLLRELANCQRSNRSLGVIMIDIDHFKNYNDTYGHDAGDYVLTEIADIMRSKLRSGDVPCRYGGEELIMIMLDTSKKTTVERAEVVRAAIENHEFMYKGKNLAGVTASIGVSVYPDDGETVSTLLKAADMALYLAKESGRNKVMVSGG